MKKFGVWDHVGPEASTTHGGCPFDFFLQEATYQSQWRCLGQYNKVIKSGKIRDRTGKQEKGKQPERGDAEMTT